MSPFSKIDNCQKLLNNYSKYISATRSNQKVLVEGRSGGHLQKSRICFISTIWFRSFPECSHFCLWLSPTHTENSRMQSLLPLTEPYPHRKFQNVVTSAFDWALPTQKIPEYSHFCLWLTPTHTGNSRM